MINERRTKTMANSFELELTLFEEGFFTVKALHIPDDPEDRVRYRLADKKVDEGDYDGPKFAAMLEKVRFGKARKFEFLVLVEGKKRMVVSVPLPEWPSSMTYTIRVARYLGEMKL
jgi:hypothetical protein